MNVGKNITPIANSLGKRIVHFFIMLKALTLHNVVVLGGLIALIIHFILYRELKRQNCVFEQINIPVKFQNLGYTDAYLVNTISNIINKIDNYQPPLRPIIEGSNKLKTNKLDLSNHEIDEIETIKVDALGVGVSFKSIVYLTDRILKAFGCQVNENYASIDLYVSDNNLCMETAYKGERNLVCRPYVDSTLKDAINKICYDAATYILGKSDPMRLADFYFNVGDYPGCIMICLDILSDNAYEDASPKTKKQIYGKAYMYWGLCVLNEGDSTSHENPLKGNAIALQITREKLMKSMSLFAENEDVKRLLLVNKLSNDPKESVSSLISNDPDNYLHRLTLLSQWAKRYSDRLRAFQGDPTIRSQLASQYYRSLDTLYRDIFVFCKNNYPPEVHYQFGTLIDDNFASYNHSLYDKSLLLYQKAIDEELELEVSNKKSVAEYYNALSYCYEEKAITFPHDSSSYSQNLTYCYYYAQQALLMDPKSPWAWSTLGEYYGLLFLKENKPSQLDSCFSAFKNAYSYGFELNNYTDSEPYKTLCSRYSAAFAKLSAIPRYYSGDMKYLKYLDLL
jgi:hypothetical protein